MPTTSTSSERSSFGAPTFVPESPFLETPAFPTEAEAEGVAFTPYSPWSETESPFVGDAREAVGQASAEAGEVLRFLGESYDEAFNEALHDLANEGFEVLHDRLRGAAPEGEAAEAERQMADHFAPLAREAEQMYDRLAQDLTRYDLANTGEAELEALLDRSAPAPAGLTPAQEAFLGGLWRKAKKAVGGAVKLAARGVAAVGRLGLGPILNRLKGLVRPLLQRVVRFALNRLPAQVRPLAQRLARRLFGREAPTELEEAEQALHEHALAVHEAAPLQLEFDLLTAETLLEGGERQESETVAHYAAEAAQAPVDSVAALRQARERFVEQFSRLEGGQDPRPALEEFLPAALLALRPIAGVALRVIGRQRVVNFLAGFLARLITRFVGREGAAPLAQAVVSLGLRLLGLEAPPGDGRRLAAETIASTMEQMLVNLAQEPEQVFENEFLLEMSAQQAFERAAAANFPSSLLRQSLLESDLPAGTWLALPRGAKRGEYKKYSVTPERTLTIAKAKDVKTFGNATLADFFRDYLGLPEGKDVKAKVHLYEAVYGTWLGRIALLERNVPGLGSAARATRALFHPLTTEAALALDLAGAGVDPPPAFLAGGEVIAVGQRFYYLELPGLPRPVSPCARVSQASVGWDLGRGMIRVAVYLSEAHAQEVATKIRAGQDVRAAAALVVNILRAGLATAVSGQIRRRDREVYEALEPEQFVGAALGALARAGGAAVAAARGAATAARGVLGGAAARAGGTAVAGGGAAGVGGFLAEQVISWLVGKILDWIVAKLQEFLRARASEFVSAAANQACGVTLMVTLTRVPAPVLIARALRGDLPSPAELFRAVTGVPDVEFRILPGFHGA